MFEKEEKKLDFKPTLDDNGYREKIKNFEKTILTWFEIQPLSKRTPEHYVMSLGLADYSEPYLAKSGKERFNQELIIYPRRFEYAEFWRNWSSLQDLRRRRTYAASQQNAELEAIASDLEKFDTKVEFEGLPSISTREEVSLFNDEDVGR